MKFNLSKLFKHPLGEWKKIITLDSINNPKIPMKLIRKGELAYGRNSINSEQSIIF